MFLDILALHRIYSGEQYWAKPRCAHISLTRANWLMGFDIFVGQCANFGKSINRSQLPRTEASGGKKNYPPRGHRGTGIYNEEMGWGSFVRALEVIPVMTPPSYCI